jgi:hypothetical protein
LPQRDVRDLRGSFTRMRPLHRSHHARALEHRGGGRRVDPCGRARVGHEVAAGHAPLQRAHACGPPATPQSALSSQLIGAASHVRGVRLRPVAADSVRGQPQGRRDLGPRETTGRGIDWGIATHRRESEHEAHVGHELGDHRWPALRVDLHQDAARRASLHRAARMSQWCARPGAMQRPTPPTESVPAPPSPPCSRVRLAVLSLRTMSALPVRRTRGSRALTWWYPARVGQRPALLERRRALPTAAQRVLQAHRPLECRGSGIAPLTV